MLWLKCTYSDQKTSRKTITRLTAKKRKRKPCRESNPKQKIGTFAARTLISMTKKRQ